MGRKKGNDTHAIKPARKGRGSELGRFEQEALEKYDTGHYRNVNAVIIKLTCQSEMGVVSGSVYKAFVHEAV